MNQPLCKFLAVIWRKRFSTPIFSVPQWARDEPMRAIYVSNVSGKYEVYAWDLSGKTKRQVTDRPEGTSIAVLTPDGEEIWWWADEAGGEAGRWMREPFLPGKATFAVEEIPPAYSAGISLGADIAVIATSDITAHRIYRSQDGKLSVIHESELVAYAGSLSRDETLLSMTHAERGDARSMAVRVIDLDGNTVAEHWDGFGAQVSLGPWSPVDGDQRLLLTRTVSGRSMPAIWDAENGTVEDLAIGLSGEIYSADWYSDASAVVLLRDQRGRREPYGFELGKRVTTKLPLERGTVSSVKVRPDGEIWYALLRSSDPVQVRALSPDGLGRSILDEEPEGVSGVSYRDFDVGPIHSFIAVPSGNGPHPTIFIAHGGPEAHDTDSFNPQVQAWVDHGFLVVLTNYRGSTGYGIEWQHSIVGRPGFKELEDLASVHDALIAQGLCDPRRTILSGPSWGGYLTLLGLGTQPERWSLGVSIVPMADLIKNYWDESESLRQYDRSLWRGSPDEAPEVWQETSPLTYVEALESPLLIVAGVNDPRSPIEQIRSYVDRVEELGKSIETYFYEAGHGSSRVDERIHQLEVMYDFARRNLDLN